MIGEKPKEKSLELKEAILTLLLTANWKMSEQAVLTFSSLLRYSILEVIYFCCFLLSPRILAL